MRLFPLSSLTGLCCKDQLNISMPSLFTVALMAFALAGLLMAVTRAFLAFLIRVRPFLVVTLNSVLKPVLAAVLSSLFKAASNFRNWLSVPSSSDSI